jgi:hypothetical protein
MTQSCPPQRKIFDSLPANHFSPAMQGSLTDERQVVVVKKMMPRSTPIWLKFLHELEMKK